ncbi:hypothetical protein ACFQ4O_07045 [Methylopila musalis]|uniref:AbrB/MazE/SpoVT family DNA-binding domain-containing protein n=1 Tax=Methylopila musalis TaxID=1134781 RepID=A0ABW3Z6H2_9HYPH
MTRIVRFEEIDGDLVLRIPADIAARRGFSAGDEVALSDTDQSLRLEPVSDDAQLALGRRVAERHREALARLAK